MDADYPKIYLYKRIVQAKLFIDDNYAEAIDLDNIAEEASFSKFHFIRLFKSIYGKTPHQYLTSVRIDRAKILLDQDVSVTQTCLNVGFESLTSFTALFRKYTKVSPSDYQQRSKERREKMKQSPLNFIPNCFAEQKGWK